MTILKDYSAGSVKHLFWFSETRATVSLYLAGHNRNDLKDIIVRQNTYQVNNAARAVSMFGTIYKRISTLPEGLLRKITSPDVASGKLVTLVGVMGADRLFFEFIYEVFRASLILGELGLSDPAIKNFFQEKRSQSDLIASWADCTTRKLSQTFVRMLFEAGLVADINKKSVIKPCLDYNLQQELQNSGKGPYLAALTGESAW